MRQRNISWATATSGFVILAVILASEGFLLSKSLDDQSAGAQSQSSHVAWVSVMKGLSHRAYNSDQQ